MDELKKALLDLAKAVETTETVERIKVTITFVKPKPSKGNESESEPDDGKD